MKNDLSCEVVRDLLPSYADELLRDVSREAVEQHLASCDVCTAVAKAMKEDLMDTQDGEDLFFIGAYRKLNVQYRFLFWAVVGLLVLIVVAVIGGAVYQHSHSAIYPVVPESAFCEVTEEGFTVEVLLPEGYYGSFGGWNYDKSSGRVTLFVEAKKNRTMEGEIAVYQIAWTEGDQVFEADWTEMVTELWVQGIDSPLWTSEDGKISG